MIRAEFFESKGILKGFKVSGHAGYGESGSDIVCAAVSSAVQLTANILDAFVGCIADVNDSDNSIKCFAENLGDDSEKIIRSLISHLEAVLDEFPKTIKITISEV